MDTSTPLPQNLQNWLSQLPPAPALSVPTGAVAFMQQLEGIAYNSRTPLRGADKKNIAWSLLPLLSTEDWCCKAKALISIGRLGDETLGEPLLAWVKQQPEPHWQLQGLDAWHQLPIAVQEKEALLPALFAWASHPVVIRGVVWLACQLPGLAMAKQLASFLSQPQSAIVKDSFLTYAWQQTSACLSSEQLATVISRYPGLRVWLRHREFDSQALYGIYPNHDYLWQMAKNAGVGQKEFKALYFKPRSKKQNPA